MYKFIGKNVRDLQYQNGAFGIGFEEAVKDFLVVNDFRVSPKGKRDLLYNGKWYEIKTGAYEFNTNLENLEKSFKGSSRVIYLPKMEQDENGNAYFDTEKALVFEKGTFLKGLLEYNENDKVLKITREKAHLQTMWINSTNSKNGNKIYRFIPFLNTIKIGTLQDLKDGLI